MWMSLRKSPVCLASWQDWCSWFPRSEWHYQWFRPRWRSSRPPRHTQLSLPFPKNMRQSQEPLKAFINDGQDQFQFRETLTIPGKAEVLVWPRPNWENYYIEISSLCPDPDVLMCLFVCVEFLEAPGHNCSGQRWESVQTLWGSKCDGDPCSPQLRKD